jgi:uncharacterized membrane protein YcaP (DUF421 family)
MDFFVDFWNEAIWTGWADLLQVVLRSAVMVAFVFVTFRYLGQRSVAQLDIFGLLLVIGLGSAVGDPMFYRDVSMSLAMMAVLVVTACFKLFNDLTARSDRLRHWATPEPVPLIESGVLSVEGMKRAALSEPELLSLVRLHGVEALHEVKAAYLEVNGQVSVIPWRRS